MSCTRGSLFGDADVAMGHSMMLLPWLTTANRSAAQRMQLSGPGRRPTSNAFVQELAERKRHTHPTSARGQGSIPSESSLV